MSTEEIKGLGGEKEKFPPEVDSKEVPSESKEKVNHTPEEIRALVDAPKAKKEPLRVKLPEGVVKSLNELAQKKQALANVFFRTSFKLVNLQKAQEELVNKMKDNDKAADRQISHAYKKLKLNKKKNYNWSFDSKDSFVGIEKPAPKENPKKK